MTKTEYLYHEKKLDEDSTVLKIACNTNEYPNGQHHD